MQSNYLIYSYWFTSASYLTQEILVDIALDLKGERFNQLVDAIP